MQGREREKGELEVEGQESGANDDSRWIDNDDAPLPILIFTQHKSAL